VLSVVAFHAFPTWMKGGFIGVDIFFVISGFLISTIIFENLLNGTFSFSDFYSRRVKRIFPALLLVLVGSYAFGWFALLTDEYKQLGKHMAAGAGFVSNYVLWGESGYFNNSAETKPLLHLWSLGIEEQFYIFWPFVLWLAWKGRISLFALTLAIAIVSFVLNVKGIEQDSVATFYSPQTRFWELLSGSILAWFVVMKKSECQRVRIGIDGWLENIPHLKNVAIDGGTLSNVFSLSGILLLTYGFFSINENSSFPGKLALVPVFGAMLIISAGPKAWFNRTILSNKLVVWFGLISFPLYLWHWPLLSISQIMEGEVPAHSIRIAAVVLSIVLAWLTYKFAEHPIRLEKNGKTKVVTLVFLMIAVGYVGYNTYSREGLGFRKAVLKASTIQELTSYPHYPLHTANCDNLFPEFKQFSACLLSKNTQPQILILGDSHSNHYYKSFANKLNNKTVMNLGQWSCLPFSSASLFEKNDCEARFLTALQFISKTPSITTVYLAGYWNYLISGGFVVENDNYRVPRPLTESEAASFISKGNRLITTIIKSGKEVILIKDIPDLDFNIKSCYELRPLVLTAKKTREICTISRSEYETRTKTYSETLTKIVADQPTLKVYDPLNILCDSNQCRTSISGSPIYYNSDHLTLRGANFIVNDILSQYPVR